MAVKFIAIKCPECGATLSIEEDRKQAFCTYCGAKVLVQNDNEHVYRHEDVAQMTYAETDRLIRLKELEIQEREREERKRAKKIKIIVCLIIIVAGLIIAPLCYHLAKASGDSDSQYYFLSCIGGFMVAFPIIGIITITSDDSKDKNS